MIIRIFALLLVCAFASAVKAKQHVTFDRQLEGGLNGKFGCDFYSIRRTGAGKMAWYPSAACWINSSHSSRTSKVWAIMPLRRVEQNETLPIWHSSKKPGSATPEPSTLYRIQYMGVSAGPNAALKGCMENIFDIDAGDLFPWFGRSAPNLLLDLFGRDYKDKQEDYILCSSGRIGIDGGSKVLMYGLTVFKDGEVLFAFTPDGFTNGQRLSFFLKDGKVFDRSGRRIESKTKVEWSYPGCAIRISDPDTISMRISYNHDLLKKTDPNDDDIHISLKNLQSILDWLSKESAPRGVWQATEKCSLEKRKIF